MAERILNWVGVGWGEGSGDVWKIYYFMYYWLEIGGSAVAKKGRLCKSLVLINNCKAFTREMRSCSVLHVRRRNAICLSTVFTRASHPRNSRVAFL